MDTKTKILQATWKILEDNPEHQFSMGEIAKSAGISRQAVYLHFPSRTALMIATTKYVDEVKGLDERLGALKDINDGTGLMESFIEIWGSYIPEIYGISKALMGTRHRDRAAAEAWENVMSCLREVCRECVVLLKKEGRLSKNWTKEEGADIFLTMISVNNWEGFTRDCGWSNAKYVKHLKKIVKKILIEGS